MNLLLMLPAKTLPNLTDLTHADFGAFNNDVLRARTGNQSATLTLDDGQGQDHAVDAGGASITYTASEPDVTRGRNRAASGASITYTASEPDVTRGRNRAASGASITYTTSEPTVTRVRRRPISAIAGGIVTAIRGFGFDGVGAGFDQQPFNPTGRDTNAAIVFVRVTTRRKRLRAITSARPAVARAAVFGQPAERRNVNELARAPTATALISC